MKKQFKSTLLAIAGVTTFLSACMAPALPLTPETLAGCYSGNSFGVEAKVDVTATEEPRSYIVNGSASGFGQSIPINNVKVSLNEQNEFVVDGNANLPVQMKLDGSEIRVTADGVPVSISLSRCPGTSAPAPTEESSEGSGEDA